MSETNFTPTKEYLHQVFEYKDGHLYWKINKQAIKAGDKAGTIDYLRPYVRITLNKKKYQEHHLVFLMFYGFLPKQIDHINGVKNDNRIENLRICTHSQNQFNTKPRNLYKNVSFYKRIEKWQVQLKIKQITLHFGFFDNLELADLVAHEVRDLYHGKFARHN